MRFEEILKHQESPYSPSLVEMGLARLEIDETIALHLRKFPEEERFYLYGKVGSLPPGEERALLEANLFGQKTGDAYFACHSPTNTLVLMATFDEETATPELFSRRLQEFVNFYSHWGKEVEAIKPRPEGEESVLELMSKRNQRLFFI